MTLAVWFSLGVLAVTIAICATALWGWHRLLQLRDQPPILPANPPKVSIIVAARDEERAIETAARSLTAIDYPALELIVVNDRSTDRTGEILDRLHAEHPRLDVVRVRDLPPGWIGKNHALHAGSQKASGDYLLFTDADVIYQASAISRAVAYCEAKKLDHLTAIPDLTSRSGFVQLYTMGGFVGLLVQHRPWRAARTGKHRLGIGAFNLVRTQAYRAAGGHAALALQVLDDIELGRMMGAGDRRQEMLLAHGMIHLEMYTSAGEMIRGIQKNVFTFLEYSVWYLIAATLLTFATSVWPWLGILVTDGVTRWINVASAAMVTGLYLHLAPRFGYSRTCLLHLPFSGIVTIALLWQIAIRTWVQGGIVWRGTFYPLKELVKARRVPTGP